MNINERLYGEVDIDEDILIELLNSNPVQRLKGISQWGPADLYPYPGGFTRYEHSIGVLCLLRKLGANLEEQIAGLLHDVSHTAFSHIIDWVVGRELHEDYQDKNHKQFILESEVPFILTKGNFSLEDITNLDNYPLLELEAPNLCADRVDYALRELADLWTYSTTRYLINHLIVYNNQTVFSSEEAATIFGRGYMNCQDEHWGGPEWVLRYHLISEILQAGLKDGTLSMDDFNQDDTYVLEKLRISQNPFIQKQLDLLSGNINFLNNSLFPKIVIRKKFRWVDPSFVSDDKLYYLSDVDAEYKQLLIDMKKDNEKGVRITII